jgi:HK97 family phage major capsid protein
MIHRTREDLDCAPMEFRSLGEYIAIVAHTATIDDQRTRNERMGVLTRTMSGISGTLGGFGIKGEWADSVWDQARTIDGPFARCRWGTCLAREFELPIFGGSSRANGSRWGGALATWGNAEIANLSVQASQPSLGNISFVMQPCAIYMSPISNNLLSDTELVGPMLDYAAKAEIRYALEYSMIMGQSAPSTAGPLNISGPQGAVSAASTVVVAKDSGQASGTVSVTNINNLWGSIASGNKRNACWHMNDNTLAAIDDLAVSGNWSESIYISAGKYGNDYPLIKGKPVFCTEVCPNLGTPGDVVVADWTDYMLILHKPKPTDSGLAFSLTQPSDSGHLGVVGLPKDAIESRRSDEFLFGNDTTAFMWRMRIDGHWMWPGKMTDANGNQWGPAAIVAQR